jgi:acyl-[acyl-carrier-protein]-phospholipid O-acyltransferase / long-chain-fatty-acid--[acyl-carrier-protein] ligase
MTVADETKGEKLIIVTNNPAVGMKTVREVLRAKGFSDLAVPRGVRFMEDLPKLGTGKIDYIKLKGML